MLVCVCLYVYQQDYCRDNWPILLKLGALIELITSSGDLILDSGRLFPDSGRLFHFPYIA